MKIRLTLALALAFLLPGTGRAAAPTPESVLGFRVGEDRKLADWHQIVDYFKRLDAASDRVVVDDVGKTTEGLPFLIATISSERNLARIEEIRRANLRLADPRGLADAEAARLVATGKTIVALNHGIHSTEVAAPQASMELAYGLATAADPETQEILDQTVMLVIPSHNPDGTQKVVEWYRKTLGTPFEGNSQIPFLYQRYVGHDNNRDWYMFTQVESRLTVRHLYDRWRPQIVHDLHQMGARSARIFAPPYVDPWEPNVDPALITAINGLGTHMAARLLGEGKTGVVVNAIYDGWTPARAYPHTHGGVRILTECASARLASPIELKFEELDRGIGYDAKRASWNFPKPWPGGAWRLRDIVDYQLGASRALLEHAARNRTFWLRNFLEVNRRAASRTEPFAFVVPAAQRDPLATARLLEVMRLGSVEVQRARAAFEAGGKSYPAGSHVIPMAQPFSAFAKSLLERQQYPDLRQYPGGPPQRPYDVTAHTLPLLMGVDLAAVASPFTADLEPVTEVRVTPGRTDGSGRFFAIGHKNGDLVALGRLLRDGVAVRWANQAFTDGGRTFAAGTLLVPSSARAKLEPLARELGITAQGVRRSPPALALRRPRVGLYQSWVASMDEGWTRFVFEKELAIDYVTLHDKDVRAGGLASRFDVVILPDQTARQIVSGHAPGTIPDEYAGGLGKEGVASLKAFAEAGGTLVTLNGASELALAELGVPAKNVLADVGGRRRGGEGGRTGPETDAFYCPGAILRVAVDATHPLAHGLDDPSIVWFEESPAFELTGGTAVARYVDENPLLSGWLLGGKRLENKAALAEVPLGKGRVVLFGFRPQYRAQSWATYVALANAVYTSAASPVK
jgi:hypothetical protein